jgi:hypothetical protein
MDIERENFQAMMQFSDERMAEIDEIVNHNWQLDYAMLNNYMWLFNPPSMDIGSAQEICDALADMARPTTIASQCGLLRRAVRNLGETVLGQLADAWDVVTKFVVRWIEMFKREDK